jgi:hypothetical protein
MKREKRRGRHQKSKTKAKSNDDKCLIAPTAPHHVPVAIMDYRSQLEKMVDSIIDEKLAFRDLATVEQDSVLKRIEKIGTTREEAFAKLSKDKSGLPTMPGCMMPPIINRRDEVRPEKMVGSDKERMLIDALELPIREGRSLIISSEGVENRSCLRAEEMRCLDDSSPCKKR